MDNFYVYMYLRANDSAHGKARSPYYIGKGKGMRAYSKDHRCKPPSDPTRIVFVVRDISESEAHLEEKRLIALYGRIDLGTGCLANLTDGGEGVVGRIRTVEERQRRCAWMSAHRAEVLRWNLGRVHTQETREKVAAAMRGKHLSEETKAKLSAIGKMPGHGPKIGHLVSAETRAKMSQVFKGRKFSEETKARMRIAARNRNTPEVKAKISATVSLLWKNGV